MCLNVIEGTTRRTAKKDFFVYKWIRTNNEAPHRTGFKYEPNKTYKLGKELRSRKGQVDAGFHAYITPAGARRSYNAFADRKLVPMIVPKNTRYYVGVNNEIVSETIKTIALDDVK
jgi:hypothetical protein